MARTTRPSRRPRPVRRSVSRDLAVGDLSSAPPASAPAPAAPVRPTARRVHGPVQIITTDYGYVVDELRRIFVLTVLIIVILIGAWLLVR